MDTQDAQGRLRGRSPVAVIDIGSNSVRLVIYEGLVRAPSMLFNEKILCGLGRGIARRNRMDDEGVDCALAALARFRALAEQAGVTRIFPLATAAAREAENGPAFIAAAERILGQPIQVLSGREEARYAANGVISGFRAPDGIVGDLGGGSLELVDVSGDRQGAGITLPLGVIRLDERAAGMMAEAQKLARADIKKAKFLARGEGRTFYAVGGTWRNLARMHMAATSYPLHVAHGYEIESQALSDFLKRLIRGEAPATPGIEEVSRNRRELLGPGAVVLGEVIRAMKPKSVVISALGLREGYLFDQLDGSLRSRDALAEAAEELSVLRSRSPQHAREMSAWTGRSFVAFGIDETVDEARWRDAACKLADIGWRAHPDYRGEQSLNIIAYASFTQIDHAGRAYIALANFFRHTGLKADAPATVAAIASARVLERAKLLAAFFRVAYLFSAAMPGVIPDIGWRERTDGAMELTLPESRRALIGDRVLGRIGQLAKVCGRRIDVAVV